MTLLRVYIHLIYIFQEEILFHCRSEMTLSTTSIFQILANSISFQTDIWKEIGKTLILMLGK